jgi:hypothetical protein
VFLRIPVAEVDILRPKRGEMRGKDGQGKDSFRVLKIMQIFQLYFWGAGRAGVEAEAKSSGRMIYTRSLPCIQRGIGRKTFLLETANPGHALNRVIETVALEVKVFSQA